MKDLFKYLGTRLAELVPDLEVREAESDITSGRIGSVYNPFDNHLHLAFNVPDTILPVADILDTQFLLCAQSLADVLNEFQIVEAQPLPLPDKSLAVSEIVQAGPLPVRFIAAYDAVNQVTRITADLLVRHVGNYYRTIINGPLHRLKMPFKSWPSDWSTLHYNYLPLERPNYYQDVEGSGYDGDSVMLPNLDETELHPEHLHSYLVKGTYCYYKGESLNS